MIVEIKNAISTYVNTNAGLLSGNVVHENFPPSDDTDEYVEVLVTPNDNEQIAIGINGTGMLSGIVVVNVYTRLDIGTGSSNTITDNVLTLFKQGTELINGAFTVKFEPPLPSGGRNDGHGFYQDTVVCPWYTYIT